MPQMAFTSILSTPIAIASINCARIQHQSILPSFMNLFKSHITTIEVSILQIYQCYTRNNHMMIIVFLQNSRLKMRKVHNGNIL
jgi:hypothetical protein